MNVNTRKIVALSDGTRSSSQIADLVGLTRRYVSKVQKSLDLPRLKEGSRRGKMNHQFAGGRHIDLDGYVLIRSPRDHPQARKIGAIAEHRHVVERELARYLLPDEVVDHIDGLTLHNDPRNLRVFASNSDHLKATISGKKKNMSPQGEDHILRQGRLPEGFQPVDTYGLNKARGAVRLRAILRAALSLGTDSPYLLGSHRWIERAEIDWSSRSSLERALAQLESQWFSVHDR